MKLSFFLVVACITVASLARFGISFCCQVVARSQYLVMFFFLCWIQVVIQSTQQYKDCYPPASIELPLFPNSTSKAAGIHVYATVPFLVKI